MRNSTSTNSPFAKKQTPFLFSKGVLLCTIVYFSIAAFAEVPAFKASLSYEPDTLDPHQAKSAASNFLLFNLYRSLYIYRDGKLTPELAKKCTRSANRLKLTCTLKPNIRWSDGSPITSADFVRGFKRLLDPGLKTPRADLLFSIRGARRFNQGAKDSSLGLSTPTASTLVIELESPDNDFEFKLSNFITTPIPKKIAASSDPTKAITNGPYSLKTWEKGRRLVLKRNPFYFKKSNISEVELSIIADDSVAVQQYLRGNLDIARRIPTTLVHQVAARKDFHKQLVLRMDYWGINQSEISEVKQRNLLWSSLSLNEITTLLNSEFPFGCFGLNTSLTDKNICYVGKLTSTANYNAKPILITYSQIGGEDLKNTAQWLADTWKNKLNISTQASGIENKSYQKSLSQNPSTVFRKAVALERPTCLAALENFKSNSDENVIRIKSPILDSILNKLETSELTVKQKQQLCREGLQELLQSELILPTGQFYYYYLLNPQFENWHINELYQLDLSELNFNSIPKATSPQ